MIGQVDFNYIKVRPSKFLKRIISYLFFEGRPLTTKGRWINPIVFSLFFLVKRMPIVSRVQKPIFIIGTGRSGTTILGVVLSMHKDVGFLNEPKALWHSAYPHEDVIGSYGRGVAKYVLDADDASRTVINSMHHLYSCYLITTRSNRVVDKYPELAFRIPFVRKIFPDAKFLFLVRNGWDTCRSIDLWSKRLGVIRREERHDWWGVNSRKWKILVEQVLPSDKTLGEHAEEIACFTEQSHRSAVEWILTMRKGVQLQKELPSYVYTVKYEDLVSSPNEICKQLLTFCDLREDSICLEYAARTLRPVNSKGPLELPSVIKQSFEETMGLLGYHL